MKTTIDNGGRVVIPKAMRDTVGLAPGGEVTIEERQGRIEIEPAPVEVVLELQGGVLVAVPKGAVPPLGSSEVREELERVRR